MSTHAHVLGYIYITVNFQLRSYINAGLTSALSIIGFALKGPQKWSFGGILGAGAKMFGGNPPRNAMTADLRRLVKKMWICFKYPSLYARQRNYKKNIKTECLCLPPKPLVTPLCMWCPMGDIITHVQYQLNRFRG